MHDYFCPQILPLLLCYHFCASCKQQLWVFSENKQAENRTGKQQNRLHRVCAVSILGGFGALTGQNLEQPHVKCSRDLLWPLPASEIVWLSENRAVWWNRISTTSNTALGGLCCDASHVLSLIWKVDIPQWLKLNHRRCRKVKKKNQPGGREWLPDGTNTKMPLKTLLGWDLIFWKHFKWNNAKIWDWKAKGSFGDTRQSLAVSRGWVVDVVVEHHWLWDKENASGAPPQRSRSTGQQQVNKPHQER